MKHKPFISIARPHKDILEGRLTMDVFAADLWKVHTGEAPDEYKDREIFFKKTYITNGLKNLLDVVENRLSGKSGDPVIQIQTPFGGGKTHSLIALYHKAKEKGVNTIVFDGTVFNPAETTIWEEIEKQLTGKIEVLKSKIAPGREKLESLLKDKLPILILMDEVLEYLNRASGVKVGDSNLATQTLSFIQELTQSVSSLGKSVLILSLPSSTTEHMDEKGEELFQKLQKIVGRIEKIYTPVEDEEIADVIKRRLFSEIDEIEAKKIINDFIDYLDKENLIPLGADKSLYRDKFIKSYPFQPEVIDILYKRWGSYTTFQRTRGVLRILALVVFSLLKKDIPFIRISDFDLENSEIRRELIKHIGNEFDSIIHADITSQDSGAKFVDKDLGSSYYPYSLGTKIATTIFMYSFSAGKERGVTINELKLSTAIPNISSSIIVEAVEKLKEKLFYLSDGGLFFTNQPNLNKVIIQIKENISNNEVNEEIKSLIGKYVSNKYFNVKIWPNNPLDIPDDKRLKLVILKDKSDIEKLYEKYGERPRIYKNTLIFLSPSESERLSLINFIKEKIAYEKLKKETSYNLTENQKKIISEKVKRNEDSALYNIRNYYRLVFVPSKDGFKEINLGMPTYGASESLDSDVYSTLKENEEILENISSKIIKNKYLNDKDYIEIKPFIEIFYKTPGELRITNDEAVLKVIKDGVKEGLFGIGYKEGELIKCKFYKEDISKEQIEDLLLINSKLCEVKKILTEDLYKYYEDKIRKTDDKDELLKIRDEISQLQPDDRTVELIDKIDKKIKGGSQVELYKKIKKLNLKLKIPKGKFSDVARVLNLINQNFEDVKLTLEIEAKDGEITISDYENKILETFTQSGIEIEE